MKKARLQQRDRGSSTLEIVGILPIVIVVLLVLLQVGAFVYALNGANQAVRDAARAASLGSSATAAAEASLPGAIKVKRLEKISSPNRYELEVTVPKFIPFTDLTVTRVADMP